MFGWFKKKPSLMDQLIIALYGDPPPKKTADVEEAVQLAYHDLVYGLVDEDELRDVARELDASPFPYSSHDLAVFTAWNFFKRPERKQTLEFTQLFARTNVLQWAKDGKIPPALLRIFEDDLYKLYRPEGT